MSKSIEERKEKIKAEISKLHELLDKMWKTSDTEEWNKLWDEAMTQETRVKEVAKEIDYQIWPVATVIDTITDTARKTIEKVGGITCFLPPGQGEIIFLPTDVMKEKKSENTYIEEGEEKTETFDGEKLTLTTGETLDFTEIEEADTNTEEFLDMHTMVS